jgi:hypothetical protein
VLCINIQTADVTSIAATEALEGLHAISSGVLVSSLRFICLCPSPYVCTQVELSTNEVEACCGSQLLNWDIFTCMKNIGGVCMASSTPVSKCNNGTCKVHKPIRLPFQL